MRHRVIPAALAVVSFLVTFTILSWQEGRWPLGKAAAHSIEAGPARKAAVVPAMPPQANRSSWSTARPRLPRPAYPAADFAGATRIALVRTQRPAAQEESSVPADAPAAPASAGEYLAERARETTHGIRAH